jgi:hypothetical protein
MRCLTSRRSQMNIEVSVPVRAASYLRERAALLGGDLRITLDPSCTA